MKSLAAGYVSGSSASRATFLSLIVAFHGLGLAAVLTLGGVALAREATPLIVRIFPQPPAPRPQTPTRSVPLPALRPPEIRLPTPPLLDNLYRVTVTERPGPPPVPGAPIAVASAPAALPAAEPPRADLAYLNNPAPSYPSISRRAGEQGRVLLRVRVDPSGKVEDIEVQKTSGFPRLDDAALNAVRRWRFLPARLGERAVPGVALVPINFQLG